MTISIRKFEIGKEYRRNNDGKNMSAIPFNYVVTARTECTVTLLEVNINGGFRFELERNICKDCNGYEYALISENEGNIRADGIPSISHLVHERDNELREIIAENAGKYPTVETFHATLIEYDNARKVTNMHRNHANATCWKDDIIRINAEKALNREIFIRRKLCTMYWTFKDSIGDYYTFLHMLYEHTDELIKATEITATELTYVA